ncbi:hypothetical protein BJX68DRAFT_260019 [Aspergillus pseudodeflectus]|uniref:Altered inheritance of mitochondria protein 9, mitochondrial n=1 Tax=Aspergillus pseudodeflectus TaxID=176178 RepID=A0ABR4JAK3_9EURO
MDKDASQTDWNSNDEFFKFTRGRFIVDEAENLQKREVRFDMNSLARVAADSVGAARCIAIKKYPDGMFNKAFLMSMDDGKEVVAKIPNPNAGVPHFTTATPRVYTWNSQAKSHLVGAEFTIMEKMQGVPLSQVWSTLNLIQKLQVLLAMTRSLYYREDMQPPAGNHFVRDGKAVRDSDFAIGPATGQDWLYQPDTEKKLTALAWYLQIVDALIPKDIAITRPCLWHNDLPDDNITGIIDWQSCHISPLFNHNPDPAFLDCDGLERETPDLVPRPKLSGLSPEERSIAMHEYTVKNVFIGWRKLMHAKNPDLYKAVEFRRTAANTPFPFNFTEADIERIKMDSNRAVAGTELVTEVKEKMGDIWPDKGFIEYERYDECKAALHEVRDLILEQLAETDEEKAEYERYWPFE